MTNFKLTVEIEYKRRLLYKLKHRLSSYIYTCRFPVLHFKYQKFKYFTMIPRQTYIKNLELAKAYHHISGSVVECGSWRGGMIAGIASILGNHRIYYLYDSFEGLPDTKEIDGISANKWQANKSSPLYFDNCRAEMDEAQAAMKISGANNVNIIKGWFNETVKFHPPETSIAILRLDGDWYESTMTCLEALYPKVAPGGLIIIDDYHTWEGCRKAVHDYLSREGLADKICQWENDIAYIVKEPLI